MPTNNPFEKNFPHFENYGLQNLFCCTCKNKIPNSFVVVYVPEKVYVLVVKTNSNKYFVMTHSEQKHASSGLECFGISFEVFFWSFPPPHKCRNQGSYFHREPVGPLQPCSRSRTFWDGRSKLLFFLTFLVLKEGGSLLLCSCP